MMVPCISSWLNSWRRVGLLLAIMVGVGYPIYISVFLPAFIIRPDADILRIATARAGVFYGLSFPVNGYKEFDSPWINALASHGLVVQQGPASCRYSIHHRGMSGSGFAARPATTWQGVPPGIDLAPIQQRLDLALQVGCGFRFTQHVADWSQIVPQLPQQDPLVLFDSDEFAWPESYRQGLLALSHQ